MSSWRIGVAVMMAAALTACGTGRKPVGAVNGDRIARAADDTTSWLSYGRTYDEQRYSPANQINTGDIGKLGLAWFSDLDTNRGQEGTPLVIDGKLYVTTAWSKVKAYDAATGKPLWDYDPQVPGGTAVKACCDVVNRGLGAWGDSLFLGTLDGRLISLDRNTGKVNWSVVTVDQSKPYTITGAPRVIKGKVIIGNGGAEMGVRGYVTAYDAATGKQLWRFYTVPDRPGANSAAYLKAAEATWKGEYWKLGGGGTVWDSMAYDPDLDLLYIGVGNGSPWNQKIRSPGGGDNLYLSSIVALKPDTGEYVWHYQTTPGETWDYTATQHMILADLKIDGATRKVLMQAPKNGFFYVIDRTDGKLISARNFVDVTWAKGVDPKTGRPIETPGIRWDETGKLTPTMPGPGGAHSWHPMAYDPQHQLVFIPAQISAFPYLADPAFKPGPQGYNTGADFATVAMPPDPKVRQTLIKSTTGALIAWDPVARKERWRVPYPGTNNGGVLATAGGLVFQGSASGAFAAFDQTNGNKLWSFDAQSGIVAPPVTYTVNGEQYVAVLAGWGGVSALAPGLLSRTSGMARNISRLLVFKLGGTAKLPPAPPVDDSPLDPPPVTGTPAQIAEGATYFGRFCGVCHGDAAISGGVIPDLRRSQAIADPALWQQIVHDGVLKDNGMVAWDKVLSKDQIEAIRHYVIQRANEDKKIGPN